MKKSMYTFLISLILPASLCPMEKFSKLMNMLEGNPPFDIQTYNPRNSHIKFYQKPQTYICSYPDCKKEVSSSETFEHHQSLHLAGNPIPYNQSGILAQIPQEKIIKAIGGTKKTKVSLAPKPPSSAPARLRITPQPLTIKKPLPINKAKTASYKCVCGFHFSYRSMFHKHLPQCKTGSLLNPKNTLDTHELLSIDPAILSFIRNTQENFEENTETPLDLPDIVVAELRKKDSYQNEALNDF